MRDVAVVALVVVPIVILILILVLPRGTTEAFRQEGLRGAWQRVRAWQADRRAQLQEQFEARRRERELGIEVGLTPSAALDQAVEVMTRAGYNVESRTQNTVTFVRRERPNPLVAGCLALLFILPAIFYVLLARNTLQITLAVYPAENGSRLVIGGDDRQGITTLKDWAKRLPKEPASSELLGPSELPESSPGGRVSLADKLRELAELRDAGIITEAEFEAKKKNLLDRM